MDAFHFFRTFGDGQYQSSSPSFLGPQPSTPIGPVKIKPSALALPLTPFPLCPSPSYAQRPAHIVPRPITLEPILHTSVNGRSFLHGSLIRGRCCRARAENPPDGTVTPLLSHAPPLSLSISPPPDRAFNLIIFTRHRITFCRSQDHDPAAFPQNHGR